MRFSSIAAFAATAHAGGGSVDSSWKTITHKGVTLIGAVSDLDLSDPSVPIPEPPASAKCTTYIPEQKFTGDDAGAFAYFLKGALNPEWDWIAYMPPTSLDGYDVIGFKNGAPCSGEMGTGKQVMVMETKGYSTTYGWWHPGAFNTTWQPYTQFAHDSCLRDKVKAWPLVVYACEPVNGGFSAWSEWGACSKTCGGGEKSQFRTCSNPPKMYGGADCIGAKTDTEKCNEQGCPVDGGFSDWSEWGACSKSCGGGSKSSFRTCSNPAPMYGGAECVGSKTNSETCNGHSCSGISAKCNDDNTISVKIDYDRAGSILSASYGTCGASDMTGAAASNAKTWDVTLNPSRCGMESKLRTLDYNQTATFTIGRKDGNTQIAFATFEVDSYCSYTSEYTVSFSYGPISADSFDFTDSGGLLGLNFYIASYSSGSYAVKADPSSQAGKTIYLKLALNATLNADFDHATSMDASSGKVFVPTKCAVEDGNSNSYTLFDTSSTDKCTNDNIDLAITYNSGDGQSWYIAHTLFLLDDENSSTFTLSCNVLVCDAAEITECKDAFHCLVPM